MSLLHKCPRTTESVSGRSDVPNRPVKVRQRSLLCIHWNLRCIFLGLDATSMKRVDGGGTVIKGSPINRFGSFGELSFSDYSRNRDTRCKQGIALDTSRRKGGL